MEENSKKWELAAKRYLSYIRFEKRLSANSIDAYMRDLELFWHYILRTFDVAPAEVEEHMIERFMQWIYEKEITDPANRTHHLRRVRRRAF